MIKVINNVKEVEIITNTDLFKNRQIEISSYLNDSFKNYNPILPQLFGKDIDIVNIIQYDNSIGYEFVIPKAHSDFITFLPNNKFQYRHQEVIDILKQTINLFDLEPIIEYDSGLGIFMYDIWEK